MKKHILTLVLFLFTATTGAFAQYQQGDIQANLGISFGVIGYGWGGLGSAKGFLPLVANVEYSVNDVFAVGPYLGYWGRTYGSGDHKSKFSVYSFGARGTFHASPFFNEQMGANINEEKLDLYFSLMLGIDVYRWTWADGWGDDYGYGDGSNFDFSPVAGIRYNFNEKFGAYFELGRGTMGIATLGASARF